MPEVIVKVDRKTKTRLEKLAKETRRPESRLVAEAIRSYVDEQEWQIEDIKQGLKEADAGDFASDREVQATLEKWRKRAGLDGSAAQTKTSTPRPNSSRKRVRKALPVLSRA